MSEKFCYSLDRDTWTGSFESRADALLEATEEARDRGITTVYTGACVPFSRHAFMPDAERVLELVHDSAYDESEHADGYPDIPADSDAHSELDALLRAWAEKHLSEPRFYTVEDEQTHDLDDDAATTESA